MNPWRSYGPIDRPNNLDDRVQITPPQNGISTIYNMQGKELGRFATAAQLAPTEPLHRRPWYCKPLYEFLAMTTGLLVVMFFTHYIAFSLGRHFQMQQEETVRR